MPISPKPELWLTKGKPLGFFQPTKSASFRHSKMIKIWKHCISFEKVESTPKKGLGVSICTSTTHNLICKLSSENGELLNCVSPPKCVPICCKKSSQPFLDKFGLTRRSFIYEEAFSGHFGRITLVLLSFYCTSRVTSFRFWKDLGFWMCLDKEPNVKKWICSSSRRISFKAFWCFKLLEQKKRKLSKLIKIFITLLTCTLSIFIKCSLRPNLKILKLTSFLYIYLHTWMVKRYTTSFLYILVWWWTLYMSKEKTFKG